MLMLLAIIGLVQSHIQRFLLWFFATLRPRHGRKLPNSSSRDNHCHSTRKPEWLKAEIIRLKAVMPRAGCHGRGNTFTRYQLPVLPSK